MEYQSSQRTKRAVPGLKLRVHNGNLIFLFLNQNICCGYPKEPFNETVLLSIQNIVKIDG